MKFTPFALALALAACGSGEPTAQTAQAADNTASTAAQVQPTQAAPAPPAAEPSGPLAVGSMAPDFELPGSDGSTHRLSDYAGQHVVLAFFPKAFTGG